MDGVRAVEGHPVHRETCLDQQVAEGLALVDERRYGDTVLHRFEPVERT